MCCRTVLARFFCAVVLTTCGAQSASADSAYQDAVSRLKQKMALGEWTTDEAKSKIDDSTNVEMQVLAKDEIDDMLGQKTRMSLVIGCSEHRTIFYVTFGGHFMSDMWPGTEVTIRIDKAPAVKKTLDASNDHMALGLWSGSAIPLIKSLFSHKTLYIRAVPLNENFLEGEFDLTGIETVIEPLRTACDWSEKKR